MEPSASGLMPRKSQKISLSGWRIPETFASRTMIYQFLMLCVSFVRAIAFAMTLSEELTQAKPRDSIWITAQTLESVG